jgi:hypothetical protein
LLLQQQCSNGSSSSSSMRKYGTVYTAAVHMCTWNANSRLLSPSSNNIIITNGTHGSECSGANYAQNHQHT